MIKFIKYFILPFFLLTSSAAVGFNGGAPLTRILTAGVVQSGGSGDLYSSTTINTPVTLATINATTANVGTLNVTGTENIGGPLNLAGAANILGTMNVTGVANFGDNLHVQGALGVSGAATFDGAGVGLRVKNDLGVSGAARIDGNESVGGALGVSGTANVDNVATFGTGVHVEGALGASGAATFDGGATVKGNGLTISAGGFNQTAGPTSFNSGNPVNIISGGLNVTGAATSNGTLSADNLTFLNHEVVLNNNSLGSYPCPDDLIDFTDPSIVTLTFIYIITTGPFPKTITLNKTGTTFYKGTIKIIFNTTAGVVTISGIPGTGLPGGAVNIPSKSSVMLICYDNSVSGGLWTPLYAP